MPSSSAVVRWFVDGNAGLIDPDNVNFMFNSHSDLVDGIITCCGEVSVYFGQELRKKVCVKKSVCVCVCVCLSVCVLAMMCICKLCRISFRFRLINTVIDSDDE